MVLLKLKNANIQNLVDKEVILNHKFAIQNPKVALPDNIDVGFDQLTDQTPMKTSGGVVQEHDQLPDCESGLINTPWTLVRHGNKKSKNNDRRDMEY